MHRSKRSRCKGKKKPRQRQGFKTSLWACFLVSTPRRSPPHKGIITIATVTVPVDRISSATVTSCSLRVAVLTTIQLKTLIPVSWLAELTALFLFQSLLSLVHCNERSLNTTQLCLSYGCVLIQSENTVWSACSDLRLALSTCEQYRILSGRP